MGGRGIDTLMPQRLLRLANILLRQDRSQEAPQIVGRHVRQFTGAGVLGHQILDGPGRERMRRETALPLGLQTP